MNMDLPRAPTVSDDQVPPRTSIKFEQIEIGKKIGSGGQAVVHKATLPNSRIDTFALKGPSELYDNRTIKSAEIQPFLNRAETWATVDARERNKQRWSKYNYVASVIDVGSSLPWVAIEYVTGGSLEDRIDSNQSRIPIEKALWIGLCLCRGLEVAHTNGIVHLDINPRNILFRKTSDSKWDSPIITDWGLARRLAEESGTMEAFSYHYAAPEQFDSDAFGNPDQLTDIYQVGCILYELLSGSPPSTGSQLSVMNEKLSGGPPSPPSETRTTIPTSIDNVILSALSTKKTDRYESIRDLRREIQDVLEQTQKKQKTPNGSKTDSSQSTAPSDNSNEKSFRERLEETREKREKRVKNENSKNDSDQQNSVGDSEREANQLSDALASDQQQQQNGFGGQQQQQNGFGGQQQQQNGFGGQQQQSMNPFPALGNNDMALPSTVHDQEVDEDLLNWRVKNELGEPIEVVETQDSFRDRLRELESQMSPSVFENDLTKQSIEFTKQYENEYGTSHPKTKLSRFTVLQFFHSVSPI